MLTTQIPNTQPLTTAHLFAGGGGDTEGVIAANGRPIWCIENDKYAAMVYRHRFQGTQTIESDIELLSDNFIADLPTPDILVGGSPCQGFSVGGQRQGLKDDRSNLFHQYVRVLKLKKPKAFVWENVPNVMKCNGGKDYETIRKSFIEAGYSTVSCLKDAERFVPQSRKRLFIVGIRQDISSGRIQSFFDLPLFNLTNNSSIIPRRSLQECLEFESLDTSKGAIVIKRGKGEVRIYFDKAPTLRSLSKTNGKQSGSGSVKIREYTAKGVYTERSIKPTECEAIMGWPNNSTAKGLTKEGKEVDISHTQRHKILGNGIVPQEITDIISRLYFIQRTENAEEMGC